MLWYNNQLLQNVKILLYWDVTKSPLGNGSRHYKAPWMIVPSWYPKALQGQTTIQSGVDLAILLLEMWSSTGNQKSGMWSSRVISHFSCLLHIQSFRLTVTQVQRHEFVGSALEVLTSINTLSHNQAQKHTKKRSNKCATVIFIDTILFLYWFVIAMSS